MKPGLWFDTYLHNPSSDCVNLCGILAHVNCTYLSATASRILAMAVHTPHRLPIVLGVIASLLFIIAAFHQRGGVPNAKKLWRYEKDHEQRSVLSLMT